MTLIVILAVVFVIVESWPTRCHVCGGDIMHDDDSCCSRSKGRTTMLASSLIPPDLAALDAILLNQEEREHVDGGNLIQAIASMRRRLGISLVQARDLVQCEARERGWKPWGERMRVIPERDLLQRLNETDAALVEARVLVEWVEEALRGEPVSDFAESFPVVREAAELRRHRDALLAHADALADLLDEVAAHGIDAGTGGGIDDLMKARGYRPRRKSMVTS